MMRQRRESQRTSVRQLDGGRSGEMKGRTWFGRSERELERGAEGNWEADHNNVYRENVFRN